MSVSRPAMSSSPNPEWAQLRENVQLPKLVGSPEELRALGDQLLAMKPPVDLSGVLIEEVNVPGYGGFENKARIYKPAPISMGRIVLIYIHGGGWTIGSLDSEHSTCVKICQDANVVVVSLNYRKAPESPFPIPLEDVWAGVCWVFDNIEHLGGQRDHILICGNSAGANMAAVCAQRAAQPEQLPDNFELDSKRIVPFRGQILRNPMVVHWDAQPPNFEFRSYSQNQNADLLPTDAVYAFVNFYNPIPNDSRFSPLLSENFNRLPPTYIQISGLDPLRDDGFAYAEKLHEAGIPVKADVYDGVPHGFMALKTLFSAQRCENDLSLAVQWLALPNLETDGIFRIR